MRLIKWMLLVTTAAYLVLFITILHIAFALRLHATGMHSRSMQEISDINIWVAIEGVLMVAMLVILAYLRPKKE